MPVVKKPSQNNSTEPAGEQLKDQIEDQSTEDKKEEQPVAQPTEENSQEDALSFLSLFAGGDDDDDDSEPANEQPPKVTPIPTVRQPKQYTLEGIQKDPEMFESYLADREEALRNQVQEEVSENILRNVTQIVAGQVTRGVAFASASQRFWDKNEDLIPFAQNFEQIMRKLGKGNPKWTPKKLHEETGKVIRTALNRTNGKSHQPNTIPSPPESGSESRKNGKSEADPRVSKMRRLFKVDDLPRR